MKLEKLKQFLRNLILVGITDCSSEEQQEVKDLITEYCSLFALDDLDLGCTSVKHSINLIDETPFKKWYCCIP